MNEVVSSGACEAIGIGLPLYVAPEEFGCVLLEGRIDVIPAVERALAMTPGALGPDVDESTFKRLESFGLLGWFCLQQICLGAGDVPDANMSVFDGLVRSAADETVIARALVKPDLTRT